jgi:hypothetical protein
VSDYTALYPALSTVLSHIEASIQAEQIFCSIVTEMTYLPAFKDQPPLRQLHRENYETSYHRNTAAGNLQRFLTGSGSSEERLILMTVECLLETHEHDRKAEDYLSQMKPASSADARWLEAAGKWHKRRKQHLKHAARTLRAAIGETLWSKGAALVT